MTARAVAVAVALMLLAGVTTGAAAADQSGQQSAMPGRLAGAAPTDAASLLSGDQLAPIGPAQGWFQPYWSGAWGSNYFGQGGWRSYGPTYGLFGPYPDPQTAAFFGATNSPLDPFTTFVLASAGFGTGAGTGLNALGGFGPLASINRTGLAPLLGFNLNTLQQLGVGTFGVNAAGAPTFTVGGQTFILSNQQAAAQITLGGLLGANIPTSYFVPGVGGVFGTGLVR